MNTSLAQFNFAFRNMGIWISESDAHGCLTCLSSGSAVPPGRSTTSTLLSEQRGPKLAKTHFTSLWIDSLCTAIHQKINFSNVPGQFCLKLHTYFPKSVLDHSKKKNLLVKHFFNIKVNVSRVIC